MRIAVIGGGAAGFFAAIHAKENFPDAHVHLFEKSQNVLAKVKVSGGGRCNVTNASESISELSKAYPRGGKLLKKLFNTFQTADTKAWFIARSVKLKKEADGRVFPVSNKSQTIIDCLLKEAEDVGVKIFLGAGVKAIEIKNNSWELAFIKESQTSKVFNKVIIATGGAPNIRSFEWLKDLGHEIEPPVPSLFTFNMPNESIISLMGVVAPNALVSIQGSKLKSSGPLLVTHWGMSGPAILKLSAFGARQLAEMKYQFVTQVNWVGEKNDALILDKINEASKANPKKRIGNLRIFEFPQRLWHFLLKKADIALDKPAAEVGRKALNKLTSILAKDEYKIEGKTTFKEEFVTCGGVSLNSINRQSLESLSCPGLYFAGEVLDIDAITGGYNFQAAWTTGFIAGRLSESRKD